MPGRKRDLAVVIARRAQWTLPAHAGSFRYAREENTHIDEISEQPVGTLEESGQFHGDSS